LVQITAMTVSSSCRTSTMANCMATLTDASMEAFMEASREARVALSCCTSCWVLRKPVSKVLRRDSFSWLRVWAMRMGELGREQAGQKFLSKNDMDDCDKGEEMSLME
jgi:hypothetical protein